MFDPATAYANGHRCRPHQTLRLADRAIVTANGAMRACGTSAKVITSRMLNTIYRVDARAEECPRRQRHASEFTDEQIIGVPREQGLIATTAEEGRRRHGISSAAFYIYGRLSAGA